MKYFADYDASGKLAGLWSGNAGAGTEISAERYAAMLTRVKTVTEYAEKLAGGTITEADVPEEYLEDAREQTAAIEAGAQQTGDPELTQEEQSAVLDRIGEALT